MIPSFEDYAREVLSLPRYLHSLRTGQTAAILCRKFSDTYHLREEEGYYVGVIHDIAREIGENELIKKAERDEYPLMDFELERPSLLHGKAAAVILKEDFDEYDQRVLQAVRWHTCGHPEMGYLGMVLYVADYIEPGRPHIDDEHAREVMQMSYLEDMVRTVLEEEFIHLREKGRRIADSADDLYNYLVKRAVEIY